jgi:hypothetical protein
MADVYKFVSSVPVLSTTLDDSENYRDQGRLGETCNEDLQTLRERDSSFSAVICRMEKAAVCLHANSTRHTSSFICGVMFYLR